MSNRFGHICKSYEKVLKEMYYVYFNEWYTLCGYQKGMILLTTTVLFYDKRI